MADTLRTNTFSKILKSPDFMIAIGVLTIVVMLIIPLPTFMLDFFMSLSIAISLLVMLLVLFSKSPLDLSIFPTLLLILTLFRLALNVSSTRLILLQGPSFNGHLIKAFGNFVVKGNYVIGLIIFIILIAVQYLVISRGTTRVSEVAARFALDSMPGKQMAIDSDLAAGLITEQEAIRKRLELQQEADFYGNMDGASKFISGDVMVGIFITLVNSIGGILIGILSFKLNATEAAKTFVLLTVGDGLVSQIPSILNATAAGIIVTRSVADDTIGKSIQKEVNKSSKPLWILTATLFIFAFFPGFPTLAFLMLSALFGSLAYFLTKKEKTGILEKEEKAKTEEEETQPQTVSKLTPIEPIALEIGYALIPLVDKSQGGDLFDRIRNVRNQIAYEYGMIVPTIVVRDSLKLDSDQYSIKIHGVEVATWKVYPDKLLAINPGAVSSEIEGEKVEEPSYNLPAVWIDYKDKDKAESFGYTVIDAATVIITHLTETLLKNVDSLLGREEVKKIIDSVREEFPTIVSEVEKSVNYGFIQKVLQNLLLEKVSIRNISTILETIADYGKDVTNPEVVVEFIRQRLKNQICKQYVDENNKLNVYTLNSSLENYLADEFEKVERTNVTSINPEFLNKLINIVIDKEKECYQKGYEYFIILVSSRLRRHLKNLLKGLIPKTIFLSFDEISPFVDLNYIDEINANFNA